MAKPPRAAPPPAGPPPDPVEARAEAVGAHPFEVVAGLAIGRFRAFYGAIFVGIGGLVLTVAWHAGPQKFLDARTFGALADRAQARIVESWVAVDFDPAQMGKYTNWRPFAKASPCVVVEYATEWSGAARRAFCGTRLPFAEHYTLHDVTEVAPGVPFVWRRDERGFIVPEIRVSTAAKRFLETHGPTSVFAPADLATSSELAWLNVAYERPADDAVAGWVQRDAAMPLALDPARPDVAWPAGFVADTQRRSPDWFATAIGLLIGLVAWIAGWNIIVGPGSRVMVAVVSTVVLLALPWWGNAFPRMVRGMNSAFGEVITDMMGDVDALDRLVVTAPEDATLAQGERIAWRAGTVYAETIGTVPLRMPEPPPGDADAALDALADAVAAHVRTQDDAERARLFARLAQDKRDGRAKAGFVFLRAARDAFIDTRAMPSMRDQARRFLEAFVTQPVEEPYPRDLGFETRIRLLRELMAIPPPNDIAIPASWIVERAEARRKAAR